MYLKSVHLHTQEAIFSYADPNIAQLPTMSTESLALIERISQISKQPQFKNDLDAQHLVSQLSRELSLKLTAPEEAANELAYYVSGSPTYIVPRR
jgi:hypothetical protein